MLNLPTGLSPEQATSLIVNCDQAFFNGQAISNRTKHIKKCAQCNVRFASQAYNYCPTCVMNNARKIDLHGEEETQVKKYKPEWTQTQRYIIAAAIILFGFIIHSLL